MTTNSEARKRREEADRRLDIEAIAQLRQRFVDVATNTLIIDNIDRLITENAELKARIAELEARCHITTDAAGHKACETCRRSAE